MKKKTTSKCTDKASGCKCHSCRMIRVRSVVRMPDRYNKWQPDQDDWLRANLYNGTLEEVADAIYERFGILRSPKALQVRAQRLGLSLISNHYSTKQVSKFLGVCQRVFMWWIWAGYFPARQCTPNRRGSSWLITDGDIEQFIHDHLALLNYKKMPPGKWRSRVEVLWKNDPYYTLTQAANIVGVTRSCIHQSIIHGKLPAEELPVGQRGKGKTKRWVVRRSSLTRFYHERRFRHLNPLPAKTDTSIAQNVKTKCSSYETLPDRQIISTASVAR